MQALWMVLGSLFFASMAVCVKYASAWFTSAELVFYRGLFGVLFMWLLARQRGVPLATRYPALHGWRGLVGVVSLGTWFYSIAYLPVATALTLNYMSSIWVAIFMVGGALLAWRPREGDAAPPGGLLYQGRLVATVLAGFAGVVLMLRPTLEQNQMFAGLVGLLSGLAAAFAYLQLMALGKVGEPETRTVFYFSLISAVSGAAVMVFAGTSPWSWDHAVWLLPVSVLATLGQLCITRAYAEGSTLVAASLQHSGVLFGAMFGIVLFGDVIALSGWAGMALIVGSGIAASLLRARATPLAPAEEH
jgi:S-adenosylmethionine uptake transporter